MTHVSEPMIKEPGSSGDSHGSVAVEAPGASDSAYGQSSADGFSRADLTQEDPGASIYEYSPAREPEEEEGEGGSDGMEADSRIEPMAEPAAAPEADAPTPDVPWTDNDSPVETSEPLMSMAREEASAPDMVEESPASIYEYAPEEPQPVQTAQAALRSVPPASPQPPMPPQVAPDTETVAQLLRRIREEYGENLPAVAAALRINPKYLSAIESGDFRQLPGRVYANGWVRAYADYLGLDGEIVVERFKAEYANANVESNMAFPAAVEEESKGGGAGIAIAALLILGGLFAVYEYGIKGDGQEIEIGSASGPVVELSESAPPPPAPVPAPSEATSTAAEPGPETASNAGPEADTSAASETTSESETEPSASPPSAAPAETASDVTTAETAPAISETENAAGTPATAPDAPVDTPAPAEAAPAAPQTAAVETAAPAPASPEPPEAAPANPVPAVLPPKPRPTGIAALAPSSTAMPVLPGEGEDDTARTPRVYGEFGTGSRIILKAEGDSWIEITDSQGNRLFSRVLMAGDSYQVPDRSGLKMRTGNAGGLQIRVDGALAPDVGPTGSVRNNVQLDPQLLLTGRAYQSPARSTSSSSSSRPSSAEAPSGVENNSGAAADQ